MMRRKDGVEKSNIRRFLNLDWDAIAGIVSAVVALVMHFLHVIEEEVLLLIAVVLLALLFLRDLRRERANERMEDSLRRAEAAVAHIQTVLNPPDAILIGPRQLRAASERFARHARGDMVWFHVCLLMFKTQSLFNTLLRPAIENPMVASIHFVLDVSQQRLWESEVVPKLHACHGHTKVQVPCWTTITENVSFILAETEPTGTTEGLLSFWGEPFMSRSTGRDIPRYIFYIQGHSELVARLIEVERHYRLGG
jgi:hypothetical protein